MSRSAASLARLTLLAGLAASHITLLMRASMGAFAIMAVPSWLGGGLLLMEREDQGRPPSMASLSRRRFALGVLLLLWPLLVLTFAARLYDPLLHLLPLFALPALALLGGAPLHSPLTGQLLLIGSLLPFQVLLNRFLPTEPLAFATARVSAFLLILLGRPAFPAGRDIVLVDQILVVDASCTGVNTISLCLAAVVLLLLLLPPPFFRRRGPLLSLLLNGALLSGFAVAAAFLVNAVRVALLGLTRQDPDATGLAQLTTFEFWHDGTGSHVFSLTAMLIVCGAYVLALEVHLRQSRPSPP